MKPKTRLNYKNKPQMNYCKKLQGKLLNSSNTKTVIMYNSQT